MPASVLRQRHAIARWVRVTCVLAGLVGFGAAALPSLAGPAAAASGPERAVARVPVLSASARFVAQPRIAPVLAGVTQACSTPTRPGQMACMALVRTTHSGGPDVSTPSGYTPADLLNAYGLATAAAKAGDGETVAIVDAYNDAHASADLAVYRQKFGLAACTTATGCLTIVNQQGGTTLPKADPTGGGWEMEESLDLDMVSAICPSCQIVLVEANSDNISDLAAAEGTAARYQGVNSVTNSWGSGSEFIGENQFDPDFYEPGVAITAAGGDDGYGTQYPATSPYVTSVGGTRLAGTTNAWTQTAWGMAGSGCSQLEPKPSWQTADNSSPRGCLNRTDNDVSADADPSTGVALYDSEKYEPDGGAPGWTVAGGTSVATPIIAATYALADIAAGGPGKALIYGTMPASYPYRATSGLTPVTGGSDGTCESDRKYLCTAVKGFNGPTGLGSPDGTAAFTGPANGGVTIIDPGTQVVRPGASLYLTLDTLPGTESPTFAMAPDRVGGLLVDKSGTLRGTAPTSPGVYRVTVTATLSGVGTSTASFSIVVLPKLRNIPIGTGEVRLDGGSHCLTDPGDSARSGTAARIDGCTGKADQQWQFRPGGEFGGTGAIKIRGRCLAIAKGSGNGAAATIQSCTASSREQWTYAGGNNVRNAGIGRCLAIHGKPATGGRAVAWTCGASTAWTLPAAPVLSGVAGLCLSDPRTSNAAGTQIVAARCSGSSAERWIANRNGTLEIAGKCLIVRGASMLSGAAAELAKCTGAASEQWQRGPGNELMNANSGRCLADPGDSGKSGTKVVQDDCYSLTGDSWLIS
jgi:ricin-type beta-trefoil lectin protein/putative Ig domain-containing protein